ncbi:MAG: NAD(P)-dependent alcohol dehydrogenase, partial [Bdellovibrionales bacterium]|nr:NAD(P)-dependent alcohol dehydrogenase [Bdellovibrionales bacterium]
MQVKAYANHAADKPFVPYSFERKAPGPKDVSIDIKYCGICHSDIHTARSEWGQAHYPCVPGHEIVGEVTAVGAEVTHLNIGDKVGVGCLVDSCRTCGSCKEGLEQYCENGWTGTYNSELPDGDYTKGGYSSHIVVDQHFVLKIPDNLDLAATAPLLCAGITTYSPMKHVGVKAGDRVAVLGLGGLG